MNLLNKWTIGKKLWVLCGFLMFNLLVVGAMGYGVSTTLLAQIRDLAFRQLPAVKAVTLVDMYNDAVFAQVYRTELFTLKGKIKNEAPEIIKDLEENRDAGIKEFENLKKVDLSAEMRSLAENLDTRFESFSRSIRELIDNAVAGNHTKVSQLTAKLEGDFKASEADYKKLTSFIQNDANKSVIEGEKKALSARVFDASVAIASLVIGLLFSFWLIPNLLNTLSQFVRSLTDEAGKLGAASSKVNGASQSLAQATTEQAAAIEETVSSMEEMTSMLGQTTQNAEKGLSVANTAQQDAQRGSEVVLRMAAAMESILASNKNLESLVAMIGQIEKKTKVINSIVVETRLLSFNASIEAAQAGVHGKGFAIVAEEVGKLATMSGKAAEEIRDLLESSTREVIQVVKETKERVTLGQGVSKECEQAFQSMNGTVEKITDAIKQIASAAHEQETGVRQTNQAMMEMDKAIQANSVAAESLTSQTFVLDGVASSVGQTSKKMYDMLFTGQDGLRQITESVVPLPQVVSRSSLSSGRIAEVIPMARVLEEEKLPSREDSAWKAR